MGFYKAANSKPSSFNSKKSYKKNPNNLDGSREDLFQVFWDELATHRTFHEGQKEIFKTFLDDLMKYTFNRIGRKGAKTTTNIVLAWAYLLMVRRATCFITLPTITQAIEVYWDESRIQWCDLDNPVLFDMFVESVDNSKHIIKFVNGSTIKLVGTWSEARGRGTQPNLLIVDEVQDCSADYLDGMEPNLAAKEDARCIMSGTPPKKRNHYHEWEERIRKNDEGKCFHYSSYINTCLPHLKPWLDKKREELIAAGKEDVWLREYMAEDCFSSDERVLPDIHLVDHVPFMLELTNVDPTAFKPVMATFIDQQKLCTAYGVMLHNRFEGVKIWIIDIDVTKRLWDISYEDLYREMTLKMEEHASTFKAPWHKLVYDETEAFTDVIPDVTHARKDLKWKNRGIPLLKEMILQGKMQFSTESDQFAVEAQNLLKEDDIREFPTVCTLAMLANEYYQAPSAPSSEQEVWDQFSPLREAGIICSPPKKKGKSLMTFNWN